MRQICVCGTKIRNFEKIYSIKKFPLFFGAIPKSKINIVKKYPLEISICNDCGLTQQTKLVNQNVLNKIYTANYYSCPSPDKSGMGIREIRKFLNFFYKCNNYPGRLLEIACFDGYILKELARKDWDVYGCDPSPSINNAIKMFGKKKIKKTFFSSTTYPKKYFDVVIFRNLLEHIYDLNEFLYNVNQSLKNDGKIFIDVPNLKEIIKLGGFGLFFHQHISYFSLETIARLLGNNGFKVNKFFEGNPNLFIEAVKVSKNNVSSSNFYKIKKIKVILKRNSEIMKTKILSYFKQKNINKIILFGASALSTTLISMLNKKEQKKIVLVVDNDKQKHNKFLCGSHTKISNPKKILNVNFDIVLVATHFFKNEIKDSLIKLGINPSKIKTIN